MALEIFGRKTSSNVQSVMWAVAELGLEHTRHDVGGAFGKTDTPEYRAMNPMGLVPAVKDGDLALFESNAIVRYLGAQYGDESFWPTDPATRAKLDIWAEWTKTTLYQTLIPGIFWTLIRTKKVDQDAAKLASLIEQIGGLMKMVEARLGDADYLGGDTLSFADIIFGHTLYRYYTLDFERASTPALDAYYERLKARPAYVEHVMVDYSSMKVE